MAPPSNVGKRVKNVQLARPFMYGTTAKLFDDKKNPKPPGTPEDHTHSWTIFVKGIDDTDITYWLKRVQFKLHESIPNHVRMVDGEPGKPFQIKETGWGEFEITLKLYYVTESNEKAQTLYHHLRLHPYGRTEEEKEAMRASGTVIAWNYEEQLFNEPYESFYDILTTGAFGPTPARGKGGGKGGAAAAAAANVTPKKSEGGVLPRSAMIPQLARPQQPFSRETEALEIKELGEAQAKIDDEIRVLMEKVKQREAELLSLKAENAAAA